MFEDIHTYNNDFIYKGGPVGLTSNLSYICEAWSAIVLSYVVMPALGSCSIIFSPSFSSYLIYNKYLDRHACINNIDPVQNAPIGAL